MSTEVKVAALPKCDVCRAQHVQHPPDATYDGKTKTGPWAFMCQQCFDQQGTGLGTGKGQRLVVGSDG